jgi:hypothetical protein
VSPAESTLANSDEYISMDEAWSGRNMWKHKVNKMNRATRVTVHERFQEEAEKDSSAQVMG